MTVSDKPLQMAKALLYKTVCECGCLESDHYFPKPRTCAECMCVKFRAVKFTVERAK